MNSDRLPKLIMEVESLLSSKIKFIQRGMKDFHDDSMECMLRSAMGGTNG